MTISGTFTGVGVAPRVSSAEALSTTLVEVTFNEAMSNNSALRNISNYNVFPTGDGVSRNVVSVTPASGGSPLSVQLLLDGALSSAAEYKVSVDIAVEDLAGNPLNPDYSFATFTAKWSTVSAVVSVPPPTEVDYARKEKMITWLGSRGMLSSEAESYIRRKRH